MFGTYQRLGVHIYASDMEVIRAARRKLQRKARRDPALKTKRKAFYRQMLAYHRHALNLARAFHL